MKKLLNTLGGCLLAAALTLTAFAGKPSSASKGGGSWPGSTAFTFDYNVGTVATNYHVYGVAGQVGTIAQPANTVILVHWYVLDLGPVTGSGSVACPAEKLFSNTGILLFANAYDVGGDGTSEAFVNPISMVEVQSGRGGFANIQIAPPHDNDVDDTGIFLYNGPLFTPFSWDLSPYVWNVEPAGW